MASSFQSSTYPLSPRSGPSVSPRELSPMSLPSSLSSLPMFQRDNTPLSFQPQPSNHLSTPDLAAKTHEPSLASLCSPSFQRLHSSVLFGTPRVKSSSLGPDSVEKWGQMSPYSLSSSSPPKHVSEARARWRSITGLTKGQQRNGRKWRARRDPEKSMLRAARVRAQSRRANTFSKGLHTSRTICALLQRKKQKHYSGASSGNSWIKSALLKQKHNKKLSRTPMKKFRSVSSSPKQKENCTNFASASVGDPQAESSPSKQSESKLEFPGAPMEASQPRPVVLEPKEKKKKRRLSEAVAQEEQEMQAFPITAAAPVFCVPFPDESSESATVVPPRTVAESPNKAHRSKTLSHKSKKRKQTPPDQLPPPFGADRKLQALLSLAHKPCVKRARRKPAPSAEPVSVSLERHGPSDTHPAPKRARSDPFPSAKSSVFDAEVPTQASSINAFEPARQTPTLSSQSSVVDLHRPTPKKLFRAVTARARSHATFLTQSSVLNLEHQRSLDCSEAPEARQDRVSSAQPCIADLHPPISTKPLLNFPQLGASDSVLSSQLASAEVDNEKVVTDQVRSESTFSSQSFTTDLGRRGLAGLLNTSKPGPDTLPLANLSSGNNQLQRAPRSLKAPRQAAISNSVPSSQESVSDDRNSQKSRLSGKGTTQRAESGSTSSSQPLVINWKLQRPFEPSEMAVPKHSILVRAGSASTRKARRRAAFSGFEVRGFFSEHIMLSATKDPQRNEKRRLDRKAKAAKREGKRALVEQAEQPPMEMSLLSDDETTSSSDDSGTDFPTPRKIWPPILRFARLAPQNSTSTELGLLPYEQLVDFENTPDPAYPTLTIDGIEKFPPWLLDRAACPAVPHIHPGWPVECRINCPAGVDYGPLIIEDCRLTSAELLRLHRGWVADDHLDAKLHLAPWESDRWYCGILPNCLPDYLGRDMLCRLAHYDIHEPKIAKDLRLQAQLDWELKRDERLRQAAVRARRLAVRIALELKSPCQSDEDYQLVEDMVEAEEIRRASENLRRSLMQFQGTVLADDGKGNMVWF